MVAVQLPDGAALGRTQQVLDKVTKIALRHAGRRSGGGDHRHLGAGQQRDAGQCRRGLCDPEGLERAQARQRQLICCRCTAHLQAALDKMPEARRPGAGAAADPGHRQCRRLHHAGGAARRQLRLREAAERWPAPSCEHGNSADRAAAAEHDVPRRRAAARGGGGPRQGGDAERLGRRRVQRARRLYRLQPTSTSSTSSAAPSRSTCRRIRSTGCEPGDIENLYVRSQDGKMVPLGALVQIQHDGRAVAGQPLQSVSDRDDRGRRRRRASAPARRWT